MRILGEHFNYDGRPKVGYDQLDARLAASAVGKMHYECKFCGEWHVGGTAPKTQN